MKKMTIKTYPKINLTLDVLSKRPDGYHEVKMLMQMIDLFDEVTVELAGEGIELRTNLPYLPCDSKNTAFKACQYFLEHFNIKNVGVKIFIQKNLPVSAGIAGGSTNAAGVLVALNELFSIHTPLETLMEIGFRVGADVPYCLMGGTALAEGLGEKLTRVPPLPETVLCIAKPDFSISTAKVYQQLDVKKLKYHPDTAGVLKALEEQNQKAVAVRLFNVLETVTVKRHPLIHSLKKTMLRHGAMGSVMSGSGPTVFGMFATEREAQRAGQALKKKAGFVCVTKTRASNFTD